MFKPRWARILVKLILIWLVITVYFYFQHPVIYRYIGIGAAIPIGEDQLVIEEITFHNLDQDKTWKIYEDLPWQYQLLVKINPPFQWYGHISSVFSFYSKLPLTKDYGTLQINGTYIYSNPINGTESENLSTFLDMYVYPTVGGGIASQYHGIINNAVAISSYNNYPLYNLNNSFIIIISDKETKKSIKLLIKPEWQKGRLFSSINNMKSPADPVDKFLYNIYQNKPREAQKYVLRGNQPDLDINPVLAGKRIHMKSTIKWIDIFEDFYGVYQVDAEVNESLENGAKDIIPPDRFTFYVQKNDNGNYEIIHYSLVSK